VPATAKEVDAAVAASLAIMRESRRLLREQRRGIVRRFEQFRLLLADLTGPTQFSVEHLASLQASIDQAVAQLTRNLQIELRAGTEGMALLGTQSVIEPVAGLSTFAKLQLVDIARISAPTVAVSLKFSADLVQKITSTVRADINGIIMRSVVGADFGQGEQAIRGVLTRNGMLTYQTRAEAIFRTETMRVGSMANDVAADALIDAGADLIKMWRWSGQSRPGHAAIDGQLREQHEMFNMPTDPHQTSLKTNPTDFNKGERAKWPRWPALSAANGINCGCQVIWLEREVARRMASRQGSTRTFERARPRTAASGAIVDQRAPGAPSTLIIPPILAPAQVLAFTGPQSVAARAAASQADELSAVASAKAREVLLAVQTEARKQAEALAAEIAKRDAAQAKLSLAFTRQHDLSAKAVLAGDEVAAKAARVKIGGSLDEALAAGVIDDGARRSMLAVFDSQVDLAAANRSTG